MVLTIGPIIVFNPFINYHSFPQMGKLRLRKVRELMQGYTMSSVMFRDVRHGKFAI